MFNKNKTNQVHAFIVEHMQDVEECLINFEGFMRAATSPAATAEILRPLAVGVGKAEDSADKALRRMIDALGGSFLASTREEIISISTSCDKVANKCESLAKMVVYQKIEFPEEFANDIMEILSKTREQFDVLKESISTFFEKFGSLLQDHSILDEIRKLESHVDIIEERLYEKIFALDLGLAHKMQLSQFIEYLADLSDIIEDIADKIQIMLISRKG